MSQRLPIPMLFATALVAGGSFWGASHALPAGPVLALWKGAAVALLALWALLAARDGAGRWIALVLVIGAVGDVVIETAGLTAGGAAFFVAHLLATGLYWRYRRADRTGGGIAILLVLGIPGAAYGVSGDLGVLIYSIALGAMAAMAWISRFPRRWVGGGALLFATSDLLIFARMGPLAGSLVPLVLVWPLYLAAQAMIAYGVVAAEDER